MAEPMNPTFARYQLRAYQRLAARVADFRLCDLNNDGLEDRVAGQMRLLIKEFESVSLFLDYNTCSAFEINVSVPIREGLGGSNMGDNEPLYVWLNLYQEVRGALTEIVLPAARKFLNQKYDYPFLA